MPLLEHHPIFHSRDADATRGFLQGVGFAFEVAGARGGGHDARLNGVYFPNSYLGYVQYGSAVRIRTTPMRTDYWLQLPLRGGVEIASGRTVVACDRRTAALASPTREHVILADEGSARCQVSITGPALLRQLASLLGETPRAPLELAPSIDLDRGYGRRLAGYLNLALADFEEDGAACWNAVAMTQLEQIIMTLLLLEHPHSYSDCLARLARPIAPRAVKRAIDFMQANLASPVTVADIAGASGVPGRTLFQHFRSFQGVSPMRYLRIARLEAARQALRLSEPGASVTEIAVGWGFTHLGRFALDYRHRFGESPRATLAAARRSRGIAGCARRAPPVAERPVLERQPRATFPPASLDPRYDRAG